MARIGRRRSSSIFNNNEEYDTEMDNLGILEHKLQVIKDHLHWQWFPIFKDAGHWAAYNKHMQKLGRRSVQLYKLLGLSAKQLINLLKKTGILDKRLVIYHMSVVLLKIICVLIWCQGKLAMAQVI